MSAYISILLERLFLAFAPLLLWIGTFCCLWALGFAFTQSTTIFWIGLIILSIAGIGKFRSFTRKDALRRLETDSDVSHRPLTSLSDIAVTEGNANLWSLEKNRQRNLIRRLRFTKPSFDFSAHDPYSLRILVILVLVCTYFISPQLWQERILQGLRFKTPDNQQAQGTESFAQLRITPPSYSALKQFS